MPIDQSELKSWASAYIEAQDDSHLDSRSPLWWAINLFHELVDEQPEDCWQVILAILARAPPDHVISVLAAGPLEDLIDVHGPAFIERIETEARRNPAFRDLLGGVWQSSTPEIWARVEKARKGVAW